MMMNLQLQELNFTLLTQDLKLSIFDLNILQSAGMIQPDWTLAEDPIYSDSGVKLVFNNQVRIVAQRNRVVFAETVGNKRLQDIRLPKMLITYIQRFSNIEYQSISINPSGYVRFDSKEAASKYMSEGLLASTPWQKFQGQEISAVGLKLSYPYKFGNFYLDINQANVEILGEEIPAVWFAGSFNYQIFGDHSSQKNYNLNNIAQAWKLDIENFVNFINNNLLTAFVLPSVSVFPDFN